MNESAPPPAALPGQTHFPRRVLVADDDTALRDISREVLARSGYTADAVADGAAAWQALNAGAYDLLVTDNNMPELSGFELLQKLRAAGLTLPVIMATGNPPAEEFTRPPWPQPAAMLFKPYSVAELLRTVTQVLREAAAPCSASPQRNDRPATETGGQPAPPLAKSAPRILVVDKDHDLRHLCALALSGPGYQVDASEDGAAAWTALQSKPYDLLIIERELPVMSGMELVEKLRAARMALPVVMTAASWPQEESIQKPELQLAARLPKPFGVVSLLATVRNVLQTAYPTANPGKLAN